MKGILHFSTARAIVAFLVALLLLSACGGSSTSSGNTSTGSTPAAKTIKVGLVTDIGGLNDRSFNQLAYQGLQQAEKDLHIQGQVVESHSANDYVPNLTNFAQAGYNLVIGVGFLMSTAVGQVAQQFPNVKFALIDAAPTDANGNTLNLSNVAPLFFREQQCGYLVGYMSGLLEKQGTAPRLKHQNTIAAMGGQEIPPVDRYIAGYEAGAKAADPSIKILLAYSGSFTDQEKGKEIGLTQISQGADILFQVAGASGLGYLDAANSQNVYAIGVDADQGYLHPQTIITSAEKHVNVAVYEIIKDVQNGTFAGTDHYFDLSDNGVGYAPPNSAVSASIIQQVNQVANQIKSGAIVPPTTVQK
jgi:basic membrane protein A